MPFPKQSYSVHVVRPLRSFFLMFSLTLAFLAPTGLAVFSVIKAGFMFSGKAGSGLVIARLPAIGFSFSQDQLFWLAALPALSGATLRIFYSFMVPIFGGRLWTTISTASLLIPAMGIGYAVQNPETPYLIFVVLALLCGLGGGNRRRGVGSVYHGRVHAVLGVARGPGSRFCRLRWRAEGRIDEDRSGRAVPAPVNGGVGAVSGIPPVQDSPSLS